MRRDAQEPQGVAHLLSTAAVVERADCDGLVTIGRRDWIGDVGIDVGSSYWEIQDVYEGRLTLDTLPGRDDSMWMYPRSHDAWPDRDAATPYFSLSVEGAVTGIGATTFMGHGCSC